jgi:hypothetical protein
MTTEISRDPFARETLVHEPLIRRPNNWHPGGFCSKSCRHAFHG